MVSKWLPRVIASLGLVGSGCVALTAFSNPASAACNYAHYRAGDASGVQNKVSVYGVIQTPYSGDITGYGSDKPSASDVYLITSSGGFVQIGWYVGSSSGLPYASSPRIFYGENVPGTRSELLQAGPGIGWNSADSYSVYSQGDYSYRFYVNGTYVGSTSYQHARQGEPVFNSEVEYLGTIMDSTAQSTSSPYKTLQYESTYGGSFAYFNDNYFGNVYGFYSGPAASSATDFTYGGGNC